jgi:hypothetical protein
MYTTFQVPNSPFPANTTITVGMDCPTLTFQIVGTFSSGSYQASASIDGVTFNNISVYKADNTLATTVTATGLYKVDLNGYKVFKLTPSSAAGTHVIYFVATSEPLGFVVLV